MINKNTNKKIFCTLGPSSMDRDTIVRLTDLGVDMFRINLSHTKIEDLEETIGRIRLATDRPICLDTEGAQVRVRYVEDNGIFLEENSLIEIVSSDVVGNPRRISFTPPLAIAQLRPGDLITIDFDAVLLLVISSGNASVKAKVLSSGRVGSNKAVTVDRPIDLPVMTEKDLEALKIGRRMGIRDYALSFADSRESVKLFRKKAGKRSCIIAKIESKKGLENLDEILDSSDSILIDRGDLSREEPIEKIPFIQKLIIHSANRKSVPVYVATNLLESMVKQKTPTRAEINDIVNTLLDGADGLVLAAETAIGSYPVNCAMMVVKTMNQYLNFSDATSLEKLERHESFLLVEPHGGTLVNRLVKAPSEGDLKKYGTIKVDRTVLMDAEQIAIGTFSPIEGFMTKKELESVLQDCRLPGGAIWTLPITLQTGEDEARAVKRGSPVKLVMEGTSEPYAILYPEDIYTYDLDKMALKVFGSADPDHPGVAALKKRGRYFIGGRIDLIKRLSSPYKHYEITPRQARAIFENKGWRRVVGFHTRNIMHNAHERIQMLAMERHNCDGIFAHPVIGPKKPGDYKEDIILKTYELMLDKCYPKGKAVLGAFQSYSRYAGPREAVFTALCRKNFGCSHFIVGRDHAGVGGYYKPYDVHKFFEECGDIGIIPVYFKEISYCKRCRDYVEKCAHSGEDRINISGTVSRQILKSSKQPPAWFMRPEISKFILDELKNGREVFIP